MSKVKFTDFPSDSYRTRGVQEEGYTFSAKLFDDGSVFGINNGRVSKLSICDKNNIRIVNYDRGWDIKPKTAEQKNAYKEIWEFLENAPKRFS